MFIYGNREPPRWSYAAVQDEAGTLEARTWPPKGTTDKWGGDDELLRENETSCEGIQWEWKQFGGATLQPAVAQVFRCMFIHHGASLPDLVLAADCQPRRDTISLQASGFTGDWISFEHHFCRSLFQVTCKRWKDWDLDSQPLHVAAYQRATCNVCNIQF